jgi:hypothetical protein
MRGSPFQEATVDRLLASTLTFFIMTCGITTLSIMTCGITTLSIMTLNILELTV